jgi:ABC-type amino acid transport substrate-binding protein
MVTSGVTTAAPAQREMQELRVVTRMVPPLVITQHGELTGFSIELWNKLMAGPLFRSGSYGIVFGQNDPWRKRVNEAPYAFREDGTYQQLYERWFTNKPNRDPRQCKA